MAWDDDKATGDDITADEWNAHVIDQKTPDFKRINVFRSDTTFDTINLDSVFVEVIGGGGGSGGVAGGTGETRLSGGGGGGGYAADEVDVSTLDSVSVTVGQGGSGGAAGDNDGAAGGDSSFGGFVSAEGGGFGPAGSDNLSLGQVVGGGGGNGTAGAIQISGGDPEFAFRSTTISGITSLSSGGATVYASNNRKNRLDINDNPTQIGFSILDDEIGHGAHGSGVVDSSTDIPGNEGANGAVIVYYS